jgi:hypothetical protein
MQTINHMDASIRGCLAKRSDNYSFRRATMGSTFAARLAGPYAAPAAASIIVPTFAASVKGSPAETSTNTARITLPAPGVHLP